jgi:hypothetical protein
MRLVKAAVLIVAIAALNFGCRTMQDRDEPLPARIVRIHGNGRGGLDARTWWALKTGNILKEGAIFQSAKDSYLDIGFGDIISASPWPPVGKPYYPEEQAVNCLRIKEDSAVKVEALRVHKIGKQACVDLRLDLQRGRIRGTAKGISPNSNYTVASTNGIVRITPGTTYELDVTGIVRVYMGRVIVTVTNTGLAKEVSDGNQFDASTGQFTPIPALFMQEFVE